MPINRSHEFGGNHGPAIFERQRGSRSRIKFCGPRGNTFGATAFVSYGAFWWSLALFVLFLHDKVPAAFVGWYLFLWGGFTAYMWVATFRSPRALQLVFLALWITFFLLAASEWTGLAWLHRAGGYGGLVTALLAFYLSAAEIINDAHGRTVLPVGAVATSQPRGQTLSPVAGPGVLTQAPPHVSDPI